MTDGTPTPPGDGSGPDRRDSSDQSRPAEVRWISREMEKISDGEPRPRPIGRRVAVLGLLVVLSTVSVLQLRSRANRPPPFTPEEEREALQALMFVAQEALDESSDPARGDPAEIVELLGDNVTFTPGAGGYTLTGRISTGQVVGVVEPDKESPELATSFQLVPEVVN